MTAAEHRGDPLQIAGLRVQSAQSAIRRGSEDWAQVPEFIGSLLEHGDWRHFIDGFGHEQQHASFEAFVTADVPAGLGTSVDVLLDVIGNRDADVERMVRDALKGKPGRPKRDKQTRDNVTALPRGRARSYALVRLHRDRPDLYDRVAAGVQSAHSAMVEAGFSRRTMTVPTGEDVDGLIRTLRRRLTRAQVAQLVEGLSIEDAEVDA